MDIRFIGREAEARKRPALWRVKYITKDGEWEPEDSPRYNLQPTKAQPGSKEKPIKVGINGNGQMLEEAAETLGDHIARGNKKKYGDYQLFYVPSSSGATAGDWVAIRSLGLQGTDEQRLASRLLALHMYEAHRQKLHVEWTAHSHGTWVLTEAMRQLAQRKIDLQQRQKIFFSDATASHLVADRSRHALNMDTSDSSWHNTAPGVAQMIGGLQLGTAPARSLIDDLRHRTDKNERLEVGLGLAWDFLNRGMFSYGVASVIIGAAAGIPTSLAMLGAGVAIASLPGAKSKYYTNPGRQLGAWLSRFRRNR